MSEVTVLMPVRNGMPYLQDAVHSLRAQTLRSWTLVVIDDGSTDGSTQYLTQLGDPRIRVRHIPQSGLGAALNVGLEMCKTEFVARMDADDISLPQRLRSQLDYLVSHIDVGLVGTQIRYCRHSSSARFSPPLPCDHNSIVSRLMNMHHAMCHGTIMCRTKALQRIGGYRVKGAGQDWDMFLRIAETSRLANLDEVLYLYRLHSQSINAVHADEVRLQRSYACDCARRRAQGQPEQSYSSFLTVSSQQSAWKKTCRKIDIVSFEQYRRGLANLLDDRTFEGYVRLLFAAAISPERVIQRVSRWLQSV